jgi:hypothetical protein
LEEVDVKMTNISKKYNRRLRIGFNWLMRLAVMAVAMDLVFPWIADIFSVSRI